MKKYGARLEVVFVVVLASLLCALGMRMYEYVNLPSANERFALASDAYVVEPTQESLNHMRVALDDGALAYCRDNWGLRSVPPVCTNGRVLTSLYQQGQVGMVKEIFDLTWLKPSPDLKKVMAQEDKCSAAWCREMVNEGLLLLGRPYDVYKRMAAVVIAGEGGGDALQGLLGYYGCTDTLNVWAELARWSSTWVSNVLGSAPYPALSAKYTPKELTQKRVALRNGHIPALEPDCPILLYQDELATGETRSIQ